MDLVAATGMTPERVASMSYEERVRWLVWLRVHREERARDMVAVMRAAVADTGRTSPSGRKR